METFTGAEDGTRTRDPNLGKVMLLPPDVNLAGGWFAFPFCSAKVAQVFYLTKYFRKILLKGGGIRREGYPLVQGR